MKCHLQVAMCWATEVIHQILRLPREIMFIIDRCHTWNVICHVREHHDSPSKVTKYCGCHEKAWNSDLTELYWPVTLLTELLRCCCTEQLLYGAVTWVSCCFTELFALLNLRNSEVSHLNFLWWRFGRFWVLYSIRFLWLILPLLQKRLPGVLPLNSEFADRCFS